ncbi:MAG: DHHA1 domain-containing protein [Chitinophagales bacterium]
MPWDVVFREKYGEFVRVVIADPTYSMNFAGHTCGQYRGDRYCRIVTETAVAAGIRRIEAITGEAVFQYIQEQAQTIQAIGDLLRTKTELATKVQHILDENSALQKELEQFKLGQLDVLKNNLLQQVEVHGDVQVIRSIVPLDSADLVKKLAYALRNEKENLFCVLGAELGGKANLTVIISDALVAAKKLDAGKIVKELGKDIDGGGGGQAFFASAGGKNPSGLQKAIDRSIQFLQ